MLVSTATHIFTYDAFFQGSSVQEASLSPKDGDGGRSSAHPGVKMIWGPEGDVAVPLARSTWLKACLGESCYKRRDGENIQVGKSECFALSERSGWGVFEFAVSLVC